MKPDWPATDVVRDLETSPDGCVASARTQLYLQGSRYHVHTTSILIAADLVLSKLLRDGEQLPDIAELRCRSLSNRELLLVASTSQSRVSRARAPAIRGTYRTEGGRMLFLEATACEDVIARRCGASGIFDEVIARICVDAGPDGTHTTRLEPVGPAWADCADPVLARYAIVEFVLEGTRRMIRERFGDIAGDALVVAAWKGFALPRWPAFAGGCVLEYRLCDGALPGGARLVHCDFSFSPDPRVARLTIARVPGARMAALKRDSQAPPDPRFPVGGPRARAE